MIIMQCHKRGDVHVYKCCESINEGMTIFIWKIDEDFTRKKILELNLGS